MSRHRPLRLGIVGLGEFGLEHLMGALDARGVEVVAVADPRRGHARTVAEHHGIAQVFADGHELLEHTDVEAIAVVSPSSTHLALAEAAVDRGVAVLLEKPVVSDIAEAARLLELDARGVIVPAHILRSGDPYVGARRSVSEDGARIRGLTARRHRRIDHLERFPDAEPVFMTMVHDIDLAIWFTAARAVSVRARAHAVRDARRIDTVLATVIDDAGRTWDLGSSWVIDGDAVPDRLELYTDRGLRVIEGTGFDAAAAMRAQYGHLADAVAGGGRRVSVGDAVHGIAIAEAILRSAGRGGADVAVTTNDEIRRSADTAR